jgi:transcriptional regulator NrdR family protein
MRDKTWLGGQTLKCPACGHNENYIVRTLPEDDGLVKRTRQCEQCGARWRTGEVRIEDLERANRVLSAVRQIQDLGVGEGV